MPTDIEIARSVTPLPITEVAKNAGVDVKHLIPYGFDKAKVDYSLLNEPTDHQAKLVLVTAINPTPAGEGKTTTTIGLADGLRRRGVKSAVALREPSLGPRLWRQGRRRRRRLGPGHPHGRHQPALYRRLPRYRCRQ